MELKALQQMLTQFKQAQEHLEKKLSEVHVEASAGGGMVRVKMNGQKHVTEMHIEPEVFNGRDHELLEDLILAAMNEASRRVDEELANQVKDITSSLPGVAGLKIPGLF